MNPETAVNVALPAGEWLQLAVGLEARANHLRTLQRAEYHALAKHYDTIVREIRAAVISTERLAA